MKVYKNVKLKNLPKLFEVCDERYNTEAEVYTREEFLSLIKENGHYESDDDDVEIVEVEE
jgi:hypothetical protein